MSNEKAEHGWMYRQFVVEPPEKDETSTTMQASSDASIQTDNKKDNETPNSQPDFSSREKVKQPRAAKYLNKKHRHHVKFFFKQMTYSWKPVLLVIPGTMLWFGLSMGSDLLDQYLPTVKPELAEAWNQLDDGWTVWFTLNDVVLWLLAILLLVLIARPLWSFFRALYLWRGETYTISPDGYSFTSPKSRLFGLTGREGFIGVDTIVGVISTPTRFDNWVTRNCSDITLQVREVEGDSTIQDIEAVKNPHKFQEAIAYIRELHRKSR